MGTTDAATESTLTYSANGMLATLKDGENNLTTFEYDGFDRLSKTRFPNTTKGSGTSSATDYEQLTYDANSNVTSRRLRDGSSITLSYDNLNRLTTKAPPNPEATLTYGYDNLGRLTAANRTGNNLSFTYDALSRNLTQGSAQGTVTSAWDAAGRRTQLTWPSGFFVNYDYLVTGEITKVRENGATTGIGVLSSYSYDDLGNRTAAAYGNGAAQALGYDPVSRLTSLTVNLSGTTSDLTKTFTYNPASQVISETRSNDAYSQVLANATQTTVTNGLNQLSTVNGTSAAYDARGNMTTDPVTAKAYSYLKTNNQLSTVSSPSTTFSYDALDRLWRQETPTITNYVSDGADAIAEYDGSNVVQKRYAFDGTGWPLVQYDAAGNRSWMLPDERGSIVALANDTSAMTAINTYDEYGIPGASNAGTFQYASMMWLSRAGIYAPTFRAYAQHFGRFNQTDPLVYAGDGPNVYAYVLDDPVNFIDPFGWEYRALNPPCGPAGCTFDPITGNIFVTGAALDFGAPLSGAGGSGGGTFGRPFSPIAGFNLNPSSGGGSNSSGGNRPAATETPLCAPASSAVYVLEFFGTAADIAALGSAGAAALTSPLPPVAIGFGIFAGTMKAISLGAGLGVTAIHAYNGNWVSAGTSFASTTIGALGGRGIQALGRIEGKKIGDLTASAAETGLAHAVSAGGC